MDDEEDLEALRLAALQSLKKKPSPSSLMSLPEKPLAPFKDQHFNGSPKGKQKRGKYFRANPPRGPRLNQTWTRNTNLISVPMVSGDEPLEPQQGEAPKLILPQDRYCRPPRDEQAASTSPTSKFDRYNNSDDSDSESGDENSGAESPRGRLKRSTSLEALMAELDNEIKGGDEKPKPKFKKRKPVLPAFVNNDNEAVIAPLIEPVEAPRVAKENLQPERRPPPRPLMTTENFPRSRGNKWIGGSKRRGGYPHHNLEFIQQPLLVESLLTFQAPPQYNPAPVPAAPLLQYNPLLYEQAYQPPAPPPPLIYDVPPLYSEITPSNLPQLIVAPPLQPQPARPPMYERPLSPLILNTDAFSTPILAPLSPRSAAFVLENRAAVEKRKRRSYSRSPSPAPRFRRSKSPPKRLASISPPKWVSPRSRSRSRSPSPIRKVLPPKSAQLSPLKKPISIHDRLGSKQGEDKPKVKEVEEKRDVLDPVLEARRRKFERNELQIKEGVIKLNRVKEAGPVEMGVAEVKNMAATHAPTISTTAVSKTTTTTTLKESPPPTPQHSDVEEDYDEELLLDLGDDTLELDPKIDVLFSDDESNSDNEGRFKIKQQTERKVPIVPFTKLMNGSKSVINNKLDVRLSDDNNSSRRNNNGSNRRINNNNNNNDSRRKRYRSKSPPINKAPPKKMTATNRNEMIRTQAPSSDSTRKVEVKTKVKSGDEAFNDVQERLGGATATTSSSGRKVEFGGAGGGSGSGDDSSGNVNEGDLRAQLSRKRAERQKHPLPDVVPSRLLQSALQSVGFSKGKKGKNKEREEAKVDGKLPIHLRLGVASSSSSSSTSTATSSSTPVATLAAAATVETSGKKSRKHKNRGNSNLDQV